MCLAGEDVWHLDCDKIRAEHGIHTGMTEQGIHTGIYGQRTGVMYKHSQAEQVWQV